VKLIVFGATGATGRSLVDQALAGGHEVTAFVRSPDALAGTGAHVVAGDVLDPAAVAAAMPGHAAVLSALGTKPWKHVDICSRGIASIIAAMQAANVRRVVAMSSQGVGDSRVGPVAGIFTRLILARSFRDKLAMEEALGATDLEWIVVRPGLLTNGPPRGRWRCDASGALRGGRIARADVAAFMLGELAGSAWLHKRPVIVW
jgi:putative NADH-flavin reductase